MERLKVEVVLTRQHPSFLTFMLVPPYGKNGVMHLTVWDFHLKYSTYGYLRSTYQLNLKEIDAEFRKAKY